MSEKKHQNKDMIIINYGTNAGRVSVIEVAVSVSDVIFSNSLNAADHSALM